MKIRLGADEDHHNCEEHLFLNLLLACASFTGAKNSVVEKNEKGVNQLRLFFFFPEILLGRLSKKGGK